MNAVAEQIGTDTTALRPFRVDVPEAELTELRRRIKSTRLPDKEPVADMSQGVPLATVQKLARYWADDYDWRRSEARINAFPNSSPRSTARNWAERAYPNLVHFNKVAKGGHFAAWEQPTIFTEELRAGFRSLRG